MLLILIFFQVDRGWSQSNDWNIEHDIVFYEEGKYGGWPANHGMWTWDGEILVGYVEASYLEKNKGLHTYDASTSKSKYARSLDGGDSWTTSDAFEMGQKTWGHNHRMSEDKAKKPMVLTEPIKDFTAPGFALTFTRHNNDYGPSQFYYSSDKGRTWKGAFEFPNLGTGGIANRTDYIIDGKQTLTVFITAAKSNGEEGRVGMARTQDGGLTWKLESWITSEHDGFDIMPSSLRLSDTELFTTIRTRTEDGLDYISAYRSQDNGKSWERLKNPVLHTGRGGSPPALVKLKDGRLALGYIFRSDNGSRVHLKLSKDNGATWGDEITLRCGDGANRDVGYPRMTQRPDGKLVMVYYWNHALTNKEKPYRYIASTIFDPSQFD
ncbi:exo-alpha-sialidase [Flagellimonas olearia]|uniref:exo-alpha-sialidase n=1 Tax=Flagellimonas olearia TaxID=552546 RepID=UPI0014793A5F|nr:sialidase family protein [Allomuricauda olearia]